MNDFLLSILLGVVEGLTEFLPVSSTGHLRIVEALFQLNLHDSFWKMYTIVIQLGAILALPVYFWNRILKFLSTFPKGERGDRNFLTHPLSLTIVAFIVTALPSWALTKVIGKNLESLWVISIALLVGGIVMWIVDATFTRVRVTNMEGMSLFQAIWIGACQILSAVFPGTSRSMCTIAAGQVVGLSRPAALEFSFFLSMPTMVVATGYDLLKTLKHSRETMDEGNIAPLAVDGHQWVVLAIGFIVSFIVALIVVAWFMRWVRARGFAPFAVYRIALAIVLIILLMRGSI
ncbi:MAG TPA: undecaprenyl-diphosphate phosphatase [Chthoniobacterales bacterium]|nr:undecaprenyl-diphosphate phosphatase [Chthoniobacterales bacterium]